MTSSVGSSGSAYVELVPKTSNTFGKDIADQVDPQAEKAGESAGSKWSKRFAAAGLAAGAVFAKELGDSLDISASNDKLSAQFDLSTQAASVAGKAASNIYKGAWGDSIEDVNDAIGSVGSSLLDLNTAGQKDIEGLTEKGLNLASVFDIDVGRSAASAGILIKTGMAKDANEAFDLITAGLQNVPKQVREDLLDATDEYSTYFHGLGFNGSQAVKLLTDASAGGAIQIDKAGDAIKEFTIRSTDMSTTSVAAYQTLGLNAKTMSDTILKGGDSAKGAFDKIVTGLIGIKDPTLQSNTAIGLFGTQMEDIGVKNIPAFLQSMKQSSDGMGEVAGAADRMGATVNGNAKTNLESFKRTALQSLTDFVGGTVIPKFTDLTNIVGTTLGDNTNKAKDVVVGAVALMAVAVGIHAATVVGSWIAMGAASVWNAALMVASWVSTGAAAVASGAETAAIALLYVGDWILMASTAVFNAALVVSGWIATGVAAVEAGIVATLQFGLQVAKWILLGATALAQAAIIAAAWLISMGPIILVGAAVVGLVILIVKNWDTISSTITDGWNWVWAETKRIWGAFVDFLSGVLDGMIFLFTHFTGPGLIISHWDDIWQATTKFWGWISDKVGDFIGFFEGLPGRIKSAASGMWDGISTSFFATINKIIGKWNSLSFSIPSIDTHIPGVGTVGGFTLDTPNIPMLAKGGVGRGTFIAGENGAEIVTVGSASRVEPHDRSMDLLAGAGQRTVIEKHYHYHNESKLTDPLADQFREMERLELPLGPAV